jgi:dihydrofolate reductase
MGRIVNATYMTLDGDISNMQDWHGPYFSEEAGAAAGAQMGGAAALIMGRATYDAFAAAWPERTTAESGGEIMNSIKKYVVSSTLQDPAWNNTTVISGDDVVDQVRKLKEETDGYILQYGFGSVTRLLLDNGLVDEVRIWLHPVLSGKAKPADLLYRDAVQTHFTFNGVETHSTGLLILSYTPKA